MNALPSPRARCQHPRADRTAPTTRTAAQPGLRSRLLDNVRLACRLAARVTGSGAAPEANPEGRCARSRPGTRVSVRRNRRARQGLPRRRAFRSGRIVRRRRTLPAGLVVGRRRRRREAAHARPAAATTDRETALAHHEAFAGQVIARLPRADFERPVAPVHEWLASRRAAPRQARFTRAKCRGAGARQAPVDGEGEEKRDPRACGPRPSPPLSHPRGAGDEAPLRPGRLCPRYRRHGDAQLAAPCLGARRLEHACAQLAELESRDVALHSICSAAHYVGQHI